jgi:hypothetical protein
MFKRQPRSFRRDGGRIYDVEWGEKEA